jgi:hypothetical protein
LKAWRAFEQIIAHQISSKQIGRIVKCKAKKKELIHSLDIKSKRRAKGYVLVRMYPHAYPTSFKDTIEIIDNGIP